MRQDVKSNYVLVEGLAAQSHSVGAHNTAAADMSLGRSVSYFVSAGTFAAGATLDAKLQHSADGSTDWTDEVAGAGNDTAITQLTAAGTAQLNVVNPRRRYYRVAAAVGTDAVVAAVVGVHGPLNSVDAG
jgi:hypothetical protein